MSTLTLAYGRPTLADRFVPHSIAADIGMIAVGAGVTAVAAQIAAPLWPVPITGQTLAVLLVGSAFGAVRGALSLTLYAVLGIVGLPVFSNAASGFKEIAGPTGGYIIGFIFAAALTGWIAQREWDRRTFKAILAFFAGTVVTFVFGLCWLTYSLASYGLPNDLNSVLEAGLYPFIVGGIIKSLLAAGIISLAWSGLGRRDARKRQRALAESVATGEMQ